MANKKLPSETLLEIMGYLEKTDLLRLRLVSRKFGSMSTQIAFREVNFELTLESLDRLHKIASNDSLRLLVKVLTLRRRTGLKSFPDFEHWQKCLRFQSEQASAEWHSLPFETRLQKHDEYQSDVAKVLDLRAYLTFRDRDTDVPLKSPELNMTCPRSKFVIALKSFDLDIAKLSRLESVVHEPGHLIDEYWGTKWGDFELDPEKIPMWTDDGLDWDADALQLSYTLRAIGWAREDLPCFRSLECSIYGPAFWSQNRMIHLWSDQEEPPHETWVMGGANLDTLPLMHHDVADIYLK